jgi:hypothetical protein
MSVAFRRTLACAALLVTAGLAGACDSGSTQAFCDEAADAASDNPAAVFAAWDPANPATTERLVHATDQLHQLADVAPPEIADDAGLIATTADDLTELLTELQGDELDAALRDREDEFAAFDQASGRVVDFTRTQCGVDLQAPPPSTTAVPADGTTTTALP